jgi:hypothetical protein
MKFFKLLLFILFFVPLSARAVGVSVSPSSVDLLSPDFVDQKISIENISSEPIIVYVRADDFSDNINILPNEFELLPEQISLVKISGDFNDFSVGTKKTNISVLSKALDKRSFNAISGIKIPLSIYIDHEYFKWSGQAVFVVVFFGLLIALVFIKLLALIFTRKTKKKRWLSINLLHHHKAKKWYKWW